MKNSKRIIFIIVVGVFLMVLALINQDKERVDSKKIVAVSTFSLYDITKHIARDTLDIVTILPFGVDPHSYEPTPKLMAEIEKSSLVIYSGAGLEPWTHGFVFKTKVIDMSQHVTLRELGSDEMHEDHHHHHEEGHDAIDPHYWLSFSNMKNATNLITEELIHVSPENEAFYLQNRDDYLKTLTKLDIAFKEKLSSCALNTIVVNHNAFGYLASEYGFHVESLSGLSPEAQPNAKNIIRLIEIIKEHNASTVFFESFASDRAMKSIAEEAHVEVGVLQPLGNVTADEASKKLTYADMMTQNLFKLSKALSCR